MYIVSTSYFDLKQIAKSGQVFRIYEDAPEEFSIYAHGKCLKASHIENSYHFTCSEDEWNKIWSNYFDIKRDYSIIAESIEKNGDTHLKEAFKLGSGIRILNQDPWEMIITFMISQNNNITRIRNSVEKICTYANLPNRAFPAATDLNPEVFINENFGLGYRNEYLYEMFKYTRENPDWFEDLKDLSYDESYQKLIKFKGIGPKVASCICLFGLGHVEAFPIDTHVKQLLNKYYPSGLDLTPYKGYEGIIQQYLFYYEIK